MSESAPRIFRVIVPVADIELATGFYRELLGQEGVRVSPGRHYFHCGPVILACYDGRADGDGEVLPPNPGHLYFAVDDPEPMFAKARHLGALDDSEEIAGQRADRIHRRPWGERSFYAADPFGNRLCFVQSSTVFRGESASDP